MVGKAESSCLLPWTLLFYPNKLGGTIRGGDARRDPDFFDSENEKNNDDDDDTLFNENVTGGIKMGCEPLQTKGTVALECEVDKLECPSSEELINEYSTDNKTKYRFPKFDAEIDMKNPTIRSWAKI
ncbi:Uncharacterized protein Adt_36318 [Abeliophyllum distichum]|uniref:Uncharacterized protein n=1 Tax=Abeliophyllum distichum TaxID=126358 RepID=A0ABD1QII5_9LAMI